ncbi:MAG TPA: ribosomal protein S18-alanine N-acetyltransferase [Gammaproteobacteria bacterium]|nr:ribosomal protein S18-alanine N-acetyltransferase [Gammaproteobacteria bacterium]
MSAVVAIPESPVYRPMRDHDVAPVMVIEKRAYRFHWSEGIFRDCLRVGYGCWIMELGGSIGGYGVLSLVVGEAHLLNICVAPEWQGQGYGRLLLEHFIELARERGAYQMLLEVRPSNKSALRLYHTRGFEQVGMRKNYYPGERGREDALILGLPL